MAELKKRLQLGFYPLLFIFAAGLVYKVINPTVNVKYSAQGAGEIRYIWNVQHRIYKGGMKPGGGTYDVGHIFPKNDYFMRFDWWGEAMDRRHCVSIVPGWFEVNIELDANGDIDMSEGGGTSMARLEECVGDYAKM